MSRSAKKRAAEAAESLRRELHEANLRGGFATTAANVCTGGVCMLPDARDGLKARGGARDNREALGKSIGLKEWSGTRGIPVV